MVSAFTLSAVMLLLYCLTFFKDTFIVVHELTEEKHVFTEEKAALSENYLNSLFG